MPAKRTAGDGGLSEKVGYYADSDGQQLEYAYWQASREVPAEMLPRGPGRKRVTGSGKSRTEALTRLGENWEAFEKGESRRGKTRLPGKPCPTAQQSFPASACSGDTNWHRPTRPRHTRTPWSR